MAFTFSEGLETDKDVIRFRLDDTDPSNFRLSDEIIASLLTKWGFGRALLEGCNSIALYYGKRLTDVGLSGGKRFAWKNQYDAYKNLYDEILAEFNAGVFGEDGMGSIVVGVLPFPEGAEEDYLPLHPLYGELPGSSEADWRSG